MSGPSSTIMNVGLRPSQQYLAASDAAARRCSSNPPLLVILDLNGCLVVRKGPNIELREHVKPFLQYLLQEYWVMVWSSAVSTNVERMLDALFTKEEQTKLVAVWDRSHFDLTWEQYDSKIQQYKHLSRVWGCSYIQQTHPLAAFRDICLWAHWGHYNTVLIDDSYEKARSEPYNHIHVPELFPSKEVLLQPGTTVLSQVAGYLDWLKYSSNVTNTIKNAPFRLNDGYNLNWQAFWGIVEERIEDEDEVMEDQPPHELSRR